MSDSVVVDLLAIFILLMSLIASSCVVAVLRKRWLSARRRGAAAREVDSVLINPDHAAEI